jgi:hypothetical protein
MDTKIIDVIFGYGRILGLTPHSDRLCEKTTRLQKFYSFLIFTLLASLLNFYFFGLVLDNTRPLSTQYILIVLLILTYVTHDFYVLIIVNFSKCAKWYQMVQCLKRVPCHKNRFTSYHLQFVMSQIVGFSLTIVGICICSFFFTITYAFGILINCIEINLQLFYVVLRCIILEMLLCRYQHQKYLVLKAGSQAHSHKLFKILTKIKHNLFLMNNAIDLFNDIFGWTTLLNIFLGSVRTLLHMDKTITKDTSVYLSNNPASIWNMLYQTTLLLIIWVRNNFFENILLTVFFQSGVIANVLLCDSVVQKHVQLLVLVTQLETNYQGVPSANEQLNSLLNTIAHLRPKFEAARFFSVDKTTLFTVSYSIVTFLLVLIQFKLNL